MKINWLFKHLFCKHESSERVRWHWTHGINGNDPRTIEVEYKCPTCGKTTYRHLDQKESYEWAEAEKLGGAE